MAVAASNVVVLVPGLGGANLTQGTRKLWFSFSVNNDAIGGFNPDPTYGAVPKQVLTSGSLSLTIPTVDGLGVDIAIVYPEIKRYLKQKGFTIVEGRDWDNASWTPPSASSIYFEFLYDWRYDSRQTALELQRFLANVVAQNYPSANIHLISYSTGGLVSRYYLSQAGAGSSNIKTHFLLGVPNHGAPKAYRILRTGVGFMGPHFPLNRFPIGQGALAHHLPSVYQLLPSDQYDNYGYPSLVHFMGKTEPKVQNCYLSEKSSIFASGIALAYYALDYVPGATPAAQDPLAKTLIENALAFHAALGKSTFLPNGKSYAVYSDNQPTLAYVDFSASKPGSGSPQLLPIGDGTVPAQSVIDLDGLEEVKKVDNVGHVKLPGNAAVLDYIYNTIKPFL
ncbi:MAG: hypothetical protein L3K15_03680 [Thermoplasmata archaeon]|nr:hypothetical protein [Thermoplasmata archaeon]